MQFSSIWPIDKALSGATTPGQSGSGSNVNEGVLHILQSSSITGTSPSDFLVSYPGHWLGGGGGNPSADVHSVYSTAQVEWAKLRLDGLYSLFDFYLPHSLNQLLRNCFTDP